MNEGVVVLANAIEELLRHQSSLRSTGLEIIIEILNKLSGFRRAENWCRTFLLEGADEKPSPEEPVGRITSVRCLACNA